MIGFGEIASAVKGVIDKFVPDAKDRLEAENLVMKQLHAINLAQIEVNKEEAKSSSLFIAGWRPFVGWVCGMTFAYSVILRDMMNWGLALYVNTTGTILPVLPAPDTTLMFELLMALLGFGGLRTYEKLKGVQR